MAMAVDFARVGVQRNEGGPFGAVIVKDGVLVGTGYNQVISTKDPTAHAEMVAIRAAASHLQSFHLTNCTLYTTCEPCPMCLAASYWARIERVVYALTRTDAATLGFSDAQVYDELSKPLHERSIEMHQCSRALALDLCDLWLQKADRINY